MFVIDIENRSDLFKISKSISVAELFEINDEAK